MLTNLRDAIAVIKQQKGAFVVLNVSVLILFVLTIHAIYWA